jgi:hypothetical protein
MRLISGEGTFVGRSLPRSSRRRLWLTNFKEEQPWKASAPRKRDIGSGQPLLAYLALLTVSLCLTFWHAYQERKGRLWDYSGAIAGVGIPDKIGIPVFFYLLVGGLWLAAIMGFAGWFTAPVRWLSFGLASDKSAISVGAIAVVIAARLSDSWYSHVRLYRNGFRPNPGLGTVPFYCEEAVVLLVVFFPGLASHVWATAIGAFVGCVVFFGFIPLLRLTRVVFSADRTRWKAGQAMQY